MLRVALLLGVAGCGLLRAPRPPETEWVEVATAHFAMWTHGSVADARHTLQEMEHQRSIVLGVAFPTVDSHRRTLVIAFADEHETSHYLPVQAAAQTWPSSPLAAPLIVMAADADATNERILAHELTHAISYEFLHRQPAWFAEGLASFFETVRLDPRSAEVAVGEPSPDRVRFVKPGQLEPVAETFACERLECHTPEFYGTAWALITFLLNNHAAELARYEQALLLAGHGAMPRWSDVVPELATAELQHQLGLWLIRGRHTVWRYKLHVETWPTTVRPLAEADVHAVEGMLVIRLRPDESARELATALRLDPTNLVANLATAARDRGLPLAGAQALVAAHGDDWRAWRLLAMAQHAAHDPAARDSTARMCALLANDPRAEPPEGLTCSTVPAP
jgi:hypothetical protein